MSNAIKEMFQARVNEAMEDDKKDGGMTLEEFLSMRNDLLGLMAIDGALVERV